MGDDMTMQGPQQNRATDPGIFTNWTAEHGVQFGKKPLVTEHNLHQRDMFTDAGIADLLDRYPRDRLSLYTMNDDPSNGGRVFRRGNAGELTGAEILEAINRGRLWLNLRAVNNHLADYDALCDEMFGELDARVPGLKTLKRDCGFLISSPHARVFYHLDVPAVTLWQLRGTKTVHVYPTGEPYARDEQIEAIVLREIEEEIDYDPAFEAGKQSFELTPGTMITWPQTAPHRVDNGECVNISLSCEYQTLETLVYANALYTNGVFRRRLGVTPRIAENGRLALYAKAALARALKTTRGPDHDKAISPVTFTVDLSRETGIRDLIAA